MVQCLDLTTRKWWEQARTFEFQEYIQADLVFLTNHSIHLQKGLLFVFQKTTFILDFTDNKVYSLSDAKHQRIMNLLGTATPWLAIPESAGISFYDPKKGEFLKIDISPSDLVSTNSKVFGEEDLLGTSPSLTGTTPMFTTSVLTLIILFLLVNNRSLRSKLNSRSGSASTAQTKDDNTHQELVLTKTSFRENLTEVENALLGLLISNSDLNKNTSVSQINHAIGLSKKEIRIQNNIRAATILLINKKFKVHSGIQDDLIQKERTEFDKRFFEYYIPKKYLSKVK